MLEASSKTAVGISDSGVKLLGGAIGSSGRVHDPSRECFELRERGRKGIFERSARTGSLSVSEPSLFKGSETLSSACDRTLAPLALVLITLSEVSGAALVAATYMLSHRRWNAGRVEIFQNDSALLMRTRCARVASRWMASSVLWTWNLLRHLSATNLGPHSQLSGRGSLRDRDDDYHSNCKIDAIRQRAPHCYGKQPLQPRDGNRRLCPSNSLALPEERNSAGTIDRPAPPPRNRCEPLVAGTEICDPVRQRRARAMACAPAQRSLLRRCTLLRGTTHLASLV